MKVAVSVSQTAGMESSNLQEFGWNTWIWNMLHVFCRTKAGESVRPDWAQDMPGQPLEYLPSFLALAWQRITCVTLIPSASLAGNNSRAGNLSLHLAPLLVLIRGREQREWLWIRAGSGIASCAGFSLKGKTSLIQMELPKSGLVPRLPAQWQQSQSQALLTQPCFTNSLPGACLLPSATEGRDKFSHNPEF